MDNDGVEPLQPGEDEERQNADQRFQQGREEAPLEGIEDIELEGLQAIVAVMAHPQLQALMQQAVGNFDDPELQARIIQFQNPEDPQFIEGLQEAMADANNPRFREIVNQNQANNPELLAAMNVLQVPDAGFANEEDMELMEQEEEEEDDDADFGPDEPDLENFSDDDDGLLDTTADDVFIGKDLQGIPWATTPWTRASYREKRNADYSSYYNCEEDVKAAASIIKSACIDATERLPAVRRYSFYRNWRRVRANIVHFQLRNLLWPVTSHQILYVANNRIMHWQNQYRKLEPNVVLDMNNNNGGAITTIRGTGSGASMASIDAMSVCTMCAKHGIVAAGGFGGELVVDTVHLNDLIDGSSSERGGEYGRPRAFGTRVTASENGITNAIDIYQSTSGAPSIVCSNNDQAIRLFDAETLTQKGEFKLDWAVNYTAAHPAQGRIVCAVGDDPDALLLDSTSGGKIATLRGHYDYSFAAAWHPDGNIIATGNQDLTTRVYDLRLTVRPLSVLGAHIGAVRSLRFSPDGRILAVAEPADYVTLYDVANEYATCQSVDLFGEIAGIGFSPDSERFYIAVSDVHYASLLQLNKAGNGRKLDEQWLLEQGMYPRK